MSQIPPFSGGTDSAREKLNDMVRVVNAILHQAGDGYIQLQRGADGITFRLAVDRLLPRVKSAAIKDYFFAKLTGASAEKYAWSEVVQDTTGAWAVKTDGRSGTTAGSDYAKEFSNTQDLYQSGVDTYVLMFALNTEGEGVTYRFPAAGGGGSTPLRYAQADGDKVVSAGWNEYTDGFIDPDNPSGDPLTLWLYWYGGSTVKPSIADDDLVAYWTDSNGKAVIVSSVMCKMDALFAD